MLGKAFICELRAIIGKNRLDYEGKIPDQRFEKASSDLRRHSFVKLNVGVLTDPIDPEKLGIAPCQRY